MGDALVNLVEGLCLVVGVGLSDNYARGGSDLLLNRLGSTGAGGWGCFRDSHFLGSCP